MDIPERRSSLDLDCARATEVKITRFFNARRLRGKSGQQKVTVEHVHVHEGGQARQRQPHRDVVPVLGVPLPMSNILPRSFPESADRSIASDGVIARGAEEDDEEEDEEDEKKDKEEEDDEDEETKTKTTATRSEPAQGEKP